MRGTYCGEESLYIESTSGMQGENLIKDLFIYLYSMWLQAKWLEYYECASNLDVFIANAVPFLKECYEYNELKYPFE